MIQDRLCIHWALTPLGYTVVLGWFYVVNNPNTELTVREALSPNLYVMVHCVYKIADQRLCLSD